MSLAATSEARTLERNAEEVSERGRIAARDGVLIREGINSITQLGPPQVLTLAGHYREAITLLNESLEWDERFGSMVGHLANLIFRGWAHLFSGDLPSAAEDSVLEFYNPADVRPSPWNPDRTGFIGVWNVSDSGDVPPRGVIKGPASGLIWPAGVAINPLNHEVYAIDSVSNALFTFSMPEFFLKAPTWR